MATKSGKKKPPPRTAEHSLKISQNAIGKNRSISDAEINAILKYKDTKEFTQEQLAVKFNQSRGQISKIWRGLLKPVSNLNTNELEELAIENLNQKLQKEMLLNKLGKETYELMMQHTQSINRRKHDFDTIIKIIMMKNTGKTSVDVAKLFKDKDGNNATRDQIRAIWTYETKLFPEEFEDDSPISFDKYEAIAQSDTIKIPKSELYKNEKKKPKPLTDEEKFQNKRKQTIEQRAIDNVNTIINIMMLKHSGQTADTVSVKFFGKNNSAISCDQVKNIWSHKTKLFEDEFTDDSPISFAEFEELAKKPRK